MRQLHYTVGDERQKVERVGSAIDLLKQMPTLLVDGILPPRSVLNELFGRGVWLSPDCSRCSWEPFALTPNEFDEIVANFSRVTEPVTVRLIEPPDWVTNFGEWMQWIDEFIYDIPGRTRAAELRRQLAPLQAELTKAEQEGDRERVRDLTSRMSREIKEWSDVGFEARKSRYLKNSNAE